MGDFGWICEYDEKDVCTWPCGQEPEQLCNISSKGNDDFVHPVKLSSYYLSKYQATLADFDLFSWLTVNLFMMKKIENVKI